MAKGKPSRKNRNTAIQYYIARISLVHQEPKSFSHIHFHATPSLNYSLEADINIFTDKKIVQIIISYIFFQEEGKIFEITVENDFKVINMESLLGELGESKNDFLVYLTDISVNHTRGVQATLIKDTPVSNFYIPSINRDSLIEKVKKKNPFVISEAMTIK